MIEKSKNSSYFGKNQEIRKITNHKNDKRFLLEQINGLQLNLKEIEKRKVEFQTKNNKQSAGSQAETEKLPMSDYLVGKCLHAEKRVHECINKLNYIKQTALKGQNIPIKEDLLSSHMAQTM